ncbi:MAG: hypothetical protein KA191_17725 [Verrucomicrobia bacterium]|jgi:hypothetical protein|nr:hypothetical protein [Verrucomicrobiota bacterium]OQC65920.1 MAG: hypothetical protein BWX48_02050 [Verrucomicrobia bacterium ADurb.Bin006]MDI9381330.1 hypothetical protein [Verrucomicrobiota bacterium]NMD21304.1 hypothetical protein [Verrucomicrobiota bacterium]HOA62958.1 hypothetical protein [Verrucomicrobiota bacterium]
MKEKSKHISMGLAVLTAMALIVTTPFTSTAADLGSPPRPMIPGVTLEAEMDFAFHDTGRRERDGWACLPHEGLRGS